MSASTTNVGGPPPAARGPAYLRPFQIARGYARQAFGAVQSVKFSVRKLSRNRYYALLDGPLGCGRDQAEALSRALDVPGEIAPLLAELLGGGAWSFMGVGASDDDGVTTCKIYLSAAEGSAPRGMRSLEWAPGSRRSAGKLYAPLPFASFADLRHRSRLSLGLEASSRIREVEVERCFERTFDILGAMSHVVDALVVREEGGKRTSLDFNIGRSEPITVEDLQDEIGDLVRALGVEEEAYRRWLGDFTARSIARVSFGLDEENRPFVTFYDSNQLHEPMPRAG